MLLKLRALWLFTIRRLGLISRETFTNRWTRLKMDEWFHCNRLAQKGGF